MTWVFFALVTAFSLATADALSKKALSHTDELTIVWVREAYALPFLFLVLLFVPIPSLDKTFWLAVVALLPLEILSLILYVKAIRISPLSLTVPFMALSPVFIVFMAFFMLGEWPDASGLAGIMAIAIGAYLLNAGASKKGALGPVKAIWKERGSALMVIVAFIYAITSILGKIAVEHSSPVFFGFFYPLVLTAVLSVLLAYKGKLKTVTEKPATFIPIGLFSGIMIASHFIAISLTDVAYMISVKRTSLLFSIVYGKYLFKEENIRERLLGSVIIIIGVVLITVF